VNTADDEVVTALIKAYVQPAPSDAECFRIMEQMREYMLFATFKDGKDFAEWLKTKGYTVGDELQQQIGDSSKTFRITSTGMVGTTIVTTTAIVDYTESNDGNVVYWRVD
jgi:hypothetical protein